MDKLEKNLKKMPLRLRQATRDLVNKVAFAIQRDARKMCPVDTGLLRTTIVPTFYRNDMAADIGTDLKYAPYVEYGTRPHYVDLGELELWAKRHNFPGGEAGIAKHIARYGTKPHPFLFPAFEIHRPRFEKGIKNILALLPDDSK